MPALRSLRDRYSEAAHVELSIGKNIESLEERDSKFFAEEVRVGIYRIVEEALANVVKHAHASAARVTLHSRSVGGICLEVTDDGVGFETNNTLESFGLLAMKDYSEALGGSCRVKSEPGHGTCIRVILPVPVDGARFQAPV